MNNWLGRTGRLEGVWHMIALLGLGELSNKPKNMIFEAKLREISVNRCCTGRHCAM